MTNKPSLWQVIAHQDWVRAVLIQTLVRQGQAVCHINSADSMDYGKWERAGIGSFLGIERDAHKANDKCMQKRCTFYKKFVEQDIYKEALRRASGGYDHVCCFQGLDQALERFCVIDSRFASAVPNILTLSGGLFFGIMMDGSAIWAAAQKSIIQVSKPKPVVQNKKAKIQFRDSNFQHIGCSFSYSAEKTELNLIHQPTFIKAARDHNLVLMSMINCNDFYEDHKKNFKMMLDRLGGPENNHQFVIQQEEKQIIGWHTTFVFQKISGV